MIEKKPIIFLHGWGLDKNCFNQLASQLADYEQVLFDLPGFGQTELPKRPWATLDYANYIKNAFLDKKSILIGYSFGGKIAIKIAADYPELVDKLILIASSGLRKKLSLKRLIRKILKKSSQDYKNAGALKPILSKIVAQDLTQDLKKIKCETLILSAENDTETPFWTARKMHKLIKSNKLVVLPGLGHHDILTLGIHQTSHQIKNFLKNAQNKI
ncbi:MAG: alpha/beta hydrolase [bacterium]